MELNCPVTINNIQEALKSYIVDNELKSLVIGVSGGIDSALCCAIAQPVCGGLSIPLIGRSLPIISNKEQEIKNANLIGEHFCLDYKESDLSSCFEHFRDTLGSFGELHPYSPISINGDNNSYSDHILKKKIREGNIKIREGNIKARLRMIYLYHLAHLNQGMVLSTDNKTEEMLGFFTICGDVGDYAMIQNLWKTEVYALSRYLVMKYSENKELGKAYALQSCIDIAPTDGLGISNSDLDQLGVDSYQTVDDILQEYLEIHETINSDIVTDNKILDKFEDLKQNPIIQRYLYTHFKRNWPNKGLNRCELFNF